MSILWFFNCGNWSWEELCRHEIICHAIYQHATILSDHSPVGKISDVWLIHRYFQARVNLIAHPKLVTSSCLFFFGTWHIANQPTFRLFWVETFDYVPIFTRRGWPTCFRKSTSKTYTLNTHHTQWLIPPTRASLHTLVIYWTHLRPHRAQTHVFPLKTYILMYF